MEAAKQVVSAMKEAQEKKQDKKAKAAAEAEEAKAKAAAKAEEKEAKAAAKVQKIENIKATTQQFIRSPPSVGELLQKVMPAFDADLEALNKANPGKVKQKMVLDLKTNTLSPAN